MIIKTLRNIFIFILFLDNATLAQVSSPKYSNEFLNLGVGARGLSMSSVQVGLVNDVTSGFWNPAGLVYQEQKYQFSFMHNSYFAGLAQYDYLGASTKLDTNSALGVSVIRFGIDNIPDTRFLFDANGAINYNNIRFFSASDYAFLLTYSRIVPQLKGLSLGANVKIIYRNVGSFANAWGFGFDVGGRYVSKNLMLGAVIRDVTTTYNLWTFNTSELRDIFATTNNKLPTASTEITLPKMVLGLGYQFLIKKRIGILPAMDLDVTFDGKRNVILPGSFASINPKFGLEVDYLKIVFIRAGIGNFQLVKNFNASTYYSLQPNVGIGVKIKKFSLDYALTNFGEQAQGLYSHVFSIKIGIQ